MSFDTLKAMLSEVSPPEPVVKRASDRRPLVLIVDDDPSTLESLELLLSSQYRLILCSSAARGVAAFVDDVCTVILDVRMKEHDGFWACEAIRKLQPDIPIIFYSAYQDAKDPFDVINAHRPFGYLFKNGDPVRILNTVDLATRLYQTTLRSRRIIERIERQRAERLRRGRSEAPSQLNDDES